MNNNTENISIYHKGMFCYKAAFIMYTTRGGGEGGGEGIWGGEEKTSEAGREEVISKLFAS